MWIDHNQESSSGYFPSFLHLDSRRNRAIITRLLFILHFGIADICFFLFLCYKLLLHLHLTLELLRATGHQLGQHRVNTTLLTLL